LNNFKSLVNARIDIIDKTVKTHTDILSNRHFQQQPTSVYRNPGGLGVPRNFTEHQNYYNTPFTQQQMDDAQTFISEPCEEDEEVPSSPSNFHSNLNSEDLQEHYYGDNDDIDDDIPISDNNGALAKIHNFATRAIFNRS